MNKTVDLLFKEAMMLSEADRVRLVDGLLTTFEPEADEYVMLPGLMK